MLVIKKQGYKRRKGSGLIDTLVSQVLPSVIPFAKTVGKEVAKKQAVDLGNRLVSKIMGEPKGQSPTTTPKKKPPPISPESKQILEKYLRSSTANEQSNAVPISTLIEGSSVRPIPIQDLVRKIRV